MARLQPTQRAAHLEAASSASPVIGRQEPLAALVAEAPLALPPSSSECPARPSRWRKAVVKDAVNQLMLTMKESS